MWTTVVYPLGFWRCHMTLILLDINQAVEKEIDDES
jgi:hypothetical protein